ncbi:Copia type Polyprotein [Phytophthora megakarya]|uniref:Copia type Polyprotein n=1 Tax=Phytophthora megakarya TaxID=4795 RepID=A0A225VBF9_9STRA|nr:Copia type Polyprotein [Phytophthora megakarya]
MAGGAIAWAARRQTVTAMSTVEAEYVAASKATMEGRGVVNLLDEVLNVVKVETKLKIGVDNNAAIALAKAPAYSNRTRHIELRWHFVHEQIKQTLLEIYKVNGTDNPADM